MQFIVTEATPSSRQKSRRGIKESKATGEEIGLNSDSKDSYHGTAHSNSNSSSIASNQQCTQHKEPSHNKNSSKSQHKGSDGKSSKEKERDRIREFEREAEKEKERQREKEIRAFREFSKELPFKHQSGPQPRRIAGSSYLQSPDYDAEDHPAHLPIPNIHSNNLSNGLNNAFHYNAGHVNLGPLGDTSSRLRGPLAPPGAPGPIPLGINTGRPQIPSIQVQGPSQNSNLSSNSIM